MRELEAYIEDLLFDHECVIIPGFGGFITNVKPAEIRDNTLFPGARNVMFNRQLKNNDGLLAGYIAKKETGDYSFALKLINGFVESANENLKQGKSIELKKIGKLNMGSDENIVFTPAANQNYAAESYGLLPVKANPLKAQPAGKKSQKALKPAGSFDWKSYSIAAAVIGILILSGILTFQNTDLKYQIYKSSFAPDIDTFMEEAEKDSQIETEQTVVPADNTKEVEINEPIPSEENIAVGETAGDSLYHIIVGAFSVKSNAYSFEKELAEKGYSPKVIMLEGSGLARVSIVQSEQRKPAETKLEEIKSKENPGAWILAVKK